MNFITFHISRLIYGFILLIPIVIGAVFAGMLETAPAWVNLVGVLLLVTYIVYAGFWATRAARLLTFEGKLFIEAIGEGRRQVNMDLMIRLAFLPIVGRFFSRSSSVEDEDDAAILSKPQDGE